MNIMSLDYAIAAGLTGVALYLLSYALLQLRIIEGNGYLYPLMNVAAALCVIISLVRDFNIASALIQISFIAISAVGIFRLFYVRNKISFDWREEHLLNDKFADLPNDVARKFFKAGEWLEVPTGATLSQAGKKISHLYYIHSGDCGVEVDGENIGSCGKGDFVGEITCFNGAPATGTVVAKNDVSLFRIEAKALRTLCKTNPELRNQLECGVADNLRTKMARINKRPLATQPKANNASVAPSNFLA